MPPPPAAIATAAATKGFRVLRQKPPPPPPLAEVTPPLCLHPIISGGADGDSPSLSPLRKWLSNGRVAVSSSPSPPSPFSYSFFSLGTPRSGATTSLSSEAFFPPPYPPLLVLQLLPFPPPLHGSRLGRGRRRKTE